MPKDPIEGFTDKNLFLIEKSDYAERTLLIWKESSNRIYNFAKQISVPYMHFLQPVQYLEGSKKLTATEKKFTNYPLYGAPLREHYYKLDINDLETNLKFDHRFIFKNENRDVYSDNSSHMNYTGMESVINNIIKQNKDIFIAELLKNKNK